MRLRNFLWVLIVLLILPVVSAASFFGGSSYLTPSNFLENEWVVFIGIFAIIFALVYVALLGALGKTTAGEQKSRGAVIVISLIVAVFGASALAQRVMWSGLVGDQIFTWVMALLFIGGFIGSLFLFKKLWEKNGLFLATSLFFFIFWLLSKFFLVSGGPLADFFNEYGLYAFYDIINFSDAWFWILLILSIIAFFVSRTRRSMAERLARQI